MTNDAASTVSEAAERMALGYDPRSLQRTRAFGRLVEQAVEAYGTALHFANDGPEEAAEAMSSALARVARGFAAGTLEALMRDEHLDLGLEQVCRLSALMIELDVETVEILADA